MNNLIDILQTYPLLKYQILVAVLASVAAGIIGTFVVVKRISMISGGIAHTVLGGMGLAAFLGIAPMLGAVVAAVLAAVLIGLVSLKAGEYEDRLISAMWSVGMAVGVVFIHLTPGYATNLLSYLFGNILLVSKNDVLLMLALDAVIILCVTALFKALTAVCFDEEQARLKGLPVELLYLALLVLTALCVVMLVRVVGIVMVIALLTLPAAISGQWTHSLRSMMAAAVVCSLFFTLAGLAIAYPTNLPAGATIVLLAGGTFLLSTALRQLRGN